MGPRDTETSTRWAPGPPAGVCPLSLPSPSAGAHNLVSLFRRLPLGQKEGGKQEDRLVPGRGLEHLFLLVCLIILQTGPDAIGIPAPSHCGFLVGGVEVRCQRKEPETWAVRESPRSPSPGPAARCGQERVTQDTQGGLRRGLTHTETGRDLTGQSDTKASSIKVGHSGSSSPTLKPPLTKVRLCRN